MKKSVVAVSVNNIRAGTSSPKNYRRTIASLQHRPPGKPNILLCHIGFHAADACGLLSFKNQTG